VEGLAGAVKSQELQIAVSDSGVGVGEGEIVGLLGGVGGVVEAAGFGVSGGEGADELRVGVFGQFAGPLGKSDGFGAVAEFGIGVGGENPGEIIEGDNVVGIETKRGAILVNRFGEASCIREGDGEIGVDLGEGGKAGESDGELADGVIPFALGGVGLAEAVMASGVGRVVVEIGLILGGGLLGKVLGEINDGKKEVCVVIVGIKAQGEIEFGGSFVKMISSEGDFPEVNVDGRVISASAKGGAAFAFSLV